VFVVFSLSDDNSLKGLEFWMEQLKDNLEPDVPCIILGNKCDLKD
jgi:GTPase SAR1 family protein